MAKYRPGPGGSRVAFNITAPTLIKAVSASTDGFGGWGGTVFRLYINTNPTGGSSAGVYDSATVAGIGAANLIASIPASGSTPKILEVIAPYYAGLVIDPGTGGVVSVSYE